MVLYFLRHGEKEAHTEYNYNPKIGHTDPPLTENGHRQAEAMARYFESKEIKKIYASRFLRNHQTAEPIAKIKGLPVIEDSRIDEIDTGKTEALPFEEIGRVYPEFWAAFTSHTCDIRFPGGETGEEVITRQKEILKEVTTSNEDVLVVSHDGYLRLLVCYILGMPVYKRYLFKTDYCGLSVFEHRDGEWRIRAYNQVLY